MKQAFVVLGIATASLVGCGQTNTAAPTATVTVTETVTATPTANPQSAEPSVPAFFAKGYPKVVSTSSIPSNMQPSVNTAKVVAVAPGVWTEKVPGVAATDAALDGSPLGYCAAVKQWEKTLKANHYETSGYSCW